MLENHWVWGGRETGINNITYPNTEFPQHVKKLYIYHSFPAIEKINNFLNNKMVEKAFYHSS